MHHDIATTVLSWLADYWWVALILLFSGVFSDIAETLIRGLSRASETRHQRKMEIARQLSGIKAERLEQERLQLEWKSEHLQQPPTPGHCVHRNVKQIRTADGELAGWLCQKLGCEKRLPPDWAVAAEDLPSSGSPPQGWVP